jgi:glycosyltransferase involved in cell wall biosynthesis
MTRALLVCPEPIGHGQPAGVGIRFLEMAKVLLADGHEVTLLSRDAGAVRGCHVDAITPETLKRYTAEADVAVVQAHAGNDLFAHGNAIPTVVDLYDPFIIQNLNYYETRGAEVFTHDHETLMRLLLHGDVFLCGSNAQRHFYIGALVAVGRVNPIAFRNDPHLASLIRIVPFGVPPHAGVPPAADSVRDVLFGGIYDWYDPILAIDTVAIARATLPDVTLTFIRHPNPSLTPQGKLADAIAYAKRNRYDFVRFQPWVAYDERAAFYGRFAAGLLTFPQSIETDFAMRVRVFDYLWGGLPVVTSSAPGTDELLTEYRAGVVVRSSSPTDFAEALVRALTDRHMRDGARRFVDEHQWPRTLQPLVDFIRAPRIDPQKDAFAATLNIAEHPRSFLERIKRRIGGSF